MCPSFPCRTPKALPARRPTLISRKKAESRLGHCAERRLGIHRAEGVIGLDHSLAWHVGYRTILMSGGAVGTAWLGRLGCGVIWGTAAGRDRLFPGLRRLSGGGVQLCLEFYLYFSHGREKRRGKWQSSRRPRYHHQQVRSIGTNHPFP